MGHLLLFSRKRNKYHFFLYESGGKIITKLTQECAPFCIGDTFRINQGIFKGRYEIKSIDEYSKVTCELIKEASVLEHFHKECLKKLNSTEK